VSEQVPEKYKINIILKYLFWMRQIGEHITSCTQFINLVIQING